MMDTLQGSGIPGIVIDGVPMVGSHATSGAAKSHGCDAGKRGKGLCFIGNTLVFKSGRPVLSAGSPGNVHCTVPQVLAYALDFKMEPYAAVDSPRMLPMNEARGIVVEDGLGAGVVEDLYKLRVRVAVTPGYDYHMGSFFVIAREQDTDKYTRRSRPAPLCRRGWYPLKAGVTGLGPRN